MHAFNMAREIFYLFIYNSTNNYTDCTDVSDEQVDINIMQVDGASDEIRKSKRVSKPTIKKKNTGLLNTIYNTFIVSVKNLLFGRATKTSEKEENHNGRTGT